MTGSWTQSFCLSVRIQIHGLSGYLLLQFWSYSFNVLQDVYTHNGGVHVHRILIYIKYLIMTGSWTQSFFYVPTTKSRGGGEILSNIHRMTGSWTSFPSYQLHNGNMVCMAPTTVFDLFIISYGQAGASFVSQTHFIFKKSLLTKQLCP